MKGILKIKDEYVALALMVIAVLPTFFVFNAMENIFMQTSCVGVHYADITLPVFIEKGYGVGNSVQWITWSANIDNTTLTAKINWSGFNTYDNMMLGLKEPVLCVHFYMQNRGAAFNPSNGWRANNLGDKDTITFNGAGAQNETIELYAALNYVPSGINWGS